MQKTFDANSRMSNIMHAHNKMNLNAEIAVFGSRSWVHYDQTKKFGFVCILGTTQLGFSKCGEISCT